MIMTARNAGLQRANANWTLRLFSPTLLAERELDHPAISTVKVPLYRVVRSYCFLNFHNMQFGTPTYY